MTHDEVTKNHHCGLQDKFSSEKAARMYETESTTDGYGALRLFISKLNLKCDALFQVPKRNWSELHTANNIWY